MKNSKCQRVFLDSGDKTDGASIYFIPWVQIMVGHGGMNIHLEKKEW